MITKRDFDAYTYPELRRQLAAASNALQQSISATWSAKQVDAWRKSLVARDCPLCGSSRDASDLIVTKHEVDVVRCRACSMVYTRHFSQGSPDLLTFTNQRTASSFLEHQETAAYSELANRKYEYYLQESEMFSAPGTLLEIGCCAGDFMKAAASRGWIPAGIDASEHFAAKASSKGFPVRTGIFPDAVSLEPDEVYQMIVLLDVLEHFPEPVASLRSLRPHLRSGGILMIQVPNFHSPLVGLQGAASTNYAFSHWSHFTARTLDAAADKAGFTALKIQTVITELDLILAYPREAVVRTIRSAVGENVAIPEGIETEWLHEHLLGYKLFGLFSVP